MRLAGAGAEAACNISVASAVPRASKSPSLKNAP